MNIKVKNSIPMDADADASTSLWNCDNLSKINVNSQFFIADKWQVGNIMEIVSVKELVEIEFSCEGKIVQSKFLITKEKYPNVLDRCVDRAAIKLELIIFVVFMTRNCKTNIVFKRNFAG